MLSKAQIKYIRSLQHKKYRQKFGRFMAEGGKIVEELLAGTALQVEAVYATDSWLAARGGALEDTVEWIPVTSEELEQISSLKTPPPVAARCLLPSESAWPAMEGQWSLGLETVQDPGNLGTIIRTADWFGIRQVFCSPDCADTFHPRTIQATMGSIARVRVITTPLLPLLREKAGRLPVLAATLGGEDVFRAALPAEGILLLGNESQGLSPGLSGAATGRVAIPGAGRAESLNVAVAAGILCSHLYRSGRSAELDRLHR